MSRVDEARWIGEQTFRFRAALVLSFLWGLSLLMPALHVRFDPSGEAGVLAGYQVLIGGWAALAYLQPGWLANPLLAALLIVWVRGRAGARTVRVLAGALVAATLATADLALRPRFHHHEGFGPGYWWWSATMLAAAGLALARPRGAPR